MQCKSSVLWFRRGLRIHDNPALLEAVSSKQNFYPIFIYDGKSAVITEDISYNRLRFFTESLSDLDFQLKKRGGKLHFIRGDPNRVLRALHKHVGMSKICFELDPEPIWHARDNSAKALLNELEVQWVEVVSHTLWDPNIIIDANGGTPPLTYQMFLHTVSVIGPPPRPVEDVDWSDVKFGELPEDLGEGIELFSSIPTPEQLGVFPVQGIGERMINWVGGETKALLKMNERLHIEEDAFHKGFYLPNQAQPDILGPPSSQSAALSLGCLSVRKLYWAVHDMFNKVYNGQLPSSQHITGQLMWREFFYTMSARNPFYGEVQRNPICLNIPWATDKNDLFLKWEHGQTGYPFIDAVMRQLHQEGWAHHVARNAVASFLTRGDLWLSWELGLHLFLRLLVDADWSVCAGNWMWVSSSAFEQLLDCTNCVCPINYGRRLDPNGEYIKRYIPELRNYPQAYLYEPWKASLEIQEKAGCVIGRDYPERIVDHDTASLRNRKMMEDIRRGLVYEFPHCCPSNEEEVRQFMWLPELCTDHVCESS